MHKDKFQETEKPAVNSTIEERVNSQPWAPAPEKVIDFKKDILEAYRLSTGVYDLKNSKKRPKIPTPFLDQYAKIGAYLQEKGQFVKQLVKLNNILAEEAKTTSTTSKILRRVLERELGAFGFQPHMGKVHDFLPSSMFREALRHGMLLKDPGLREFYHGDFTHAIQWLMIAWQHQESQFLGESEVKADRLVVNIFKSLGQNNAVISSKEQTTAGLANGESSIWDLLVDRTPQTYNGKRHILENKWEVDPHGFCSPENLHIFLFKNTIPQLAFLKILIRKKETKRDEETVDQLLAKDEQKQTILDLELRNPKNSHYFFYSPSPLQLPATELGDEKNSLNELALKMDTIKSDDKTGFSPTEYKNYMQTFLRAEEHFNIGEYDKAIKFFLKIEKFYTQAYPRAAVLQNLFYNLGSSYKFKQNLKLADYYFRKALQVSLDNLGEERSDQKHLIPLSKVMNELGTTQHILRMKAQAEADKADDNTSQCIIA